MCEQRSAAITSYIAMIYHGNFSEEIFIKLQHYGYNSYVTVGAKLYRNSSFTNEMGMCNFLTGAQSILSDQWRR